MSTELSLGGSIVRTGRWPGVAPPLDPRLEPLLELSLSPDQNSVSELEPGPRECL